MSETPLAIFIGIEGYALTADEAALLREANPYGLFLFRRNIDTADQVRRLCAQIRETLGRADAPIFIDQEGGRVQRLNNGNFPDFRPLGSFGALARKDLELGKRALRLSRNIAGSSRSRSAMKTKIAGVTPSQNIQRHAESGGSAANSTEDMIAATA